MNDRLVNKLDKSLSKINDIEAEYLFTIAVPATTTTTATAAMSKCQCQKWIYIVHSLRKTSNALNTLVLWKSLQWLSVTVHSTLRIPHVFRQWVPDRRTSNRKSPTAVGAEPVAWNGDLMAAGRMQALAENSVRNCMCSGRSDTEELGCVGIGTWAATTTPTAVAAVMTPGRKIQHWE